MPLKSDQNSQPQPASANLAPTDRVLDTACTDCMLRQLSRAVSRHFDENLRTHGLNGSQYSLLSHIGEVGSAQLNHVAKALRVEASTISRTVFNLAESGLIEVIEGKNRRTMAVRLTRYGRRTLAAAASSWDTADKALEQKLGTHTYQLLNSLLDQSLTVLEAASH